MIMNYFMNNLVFHAFEKNDLNAMVHRKHYRIN